MDALATDVAVLSIGAGLDVASTHWALSSCSSCYERNPIMSEPAVAIAVKAAAVAGTAAACGRLRRDGHGRAAKVLRWTVFSVWAGIAANNVRTARKYR